MNELSGVALDTFRRQRLILLYKCATQIPLTSEADWAHAVSEAFPSDTADLFGVITTG